MGSGDRVVENRVPPNKKPKTEKYPSSKHPRLQIGVIPKRAATVSNTLDQIL